MSVGRAGASQPYVPVPPCVSSFQMPPHSALPGIKHVYFLICFLDSAPQDSVSDCWLRADFRGFYQDRDPLIWGASSRSLLSQMFTIKSGKGKWREVGGTGVSTDTMEAFSHWGERGLRTPEEVLGRGCVQRREGQPPKVETGWCWSGIDDLSEPYSIYFKGA